MNYHNNIYYLKLILLYNKIIIKNINMSYLIFDRLPIEMRMMVFDHLVIDKSILGKLCLTSYNWQIITQNSYTWKLWITSLLGKENGIKWCRHSIIYGTHINDPLLHVQLAPADIISNRLKTLLFKKFLFILHNNKQRFVPSKWLEILCHIGNLQAIKLLHSSYRLTLRNIRDSDYYPFIRACGKGHLSTAQWLASTLHMTAQDARLAHNKALRMAAKYGHLSIVQWLCANFNFTIDDIRDNEIVIESCENGHLLLLKWLHSTFHLTAEDARYDDNWSLLLACQNGHLLTAIWLHETFHLTTADARTDNSFALRQACTCGHLDVVQWLHNTFDFIESDFRDDEFDAFMTACSCGYLVMAQWLNGIFPVAKENAPNVNSYIIYIISINKRMRRTHMVEWLLETFNIDPE